MRTAYNLVAIRNGKILLVRKGEVWILPGGKPQNGESAAACIVRECAEELPGSKANVQHYYNEFSGMTPHTGDRLKASVYLGTLSGELKPGAEIAEVRFADAAQCASMDLSDITRKIVLRLIEDSRL